MPPRYVRIPFGERLTYPKICGFTGKKNPTSLVRIERHEIQMWLPIPFLGFFKLGKVGSIVFPATQRFAIVAKILAILPWLFVISGFSSLFWLKDQTNLWLFPIGGVALMYFSFGLEWLWLRRVRIVRIGMNSLEIRFESEEYAEELSRINELACNSKPTRKRATLVTVNDVR